MALQPVPPEELPSLKAMYAALKPNAARILRAIEYSCQWGSTPDGGMDRLSADNNDKLVREWFISETTKYGCVHKIDQMGNIFAIRPGHNNQLPPIAIGSHLDTQPTGGKYDGILGVISGLEVLRTIHDNSITTYAPLAVINWTNEEGARFPPAMLASGVWAGEFTVEYGLSRADQQGQTIREELQKIGFQGPEPCSYKAVPLLAHFEVHIEQGPILDEAEQPAAVVKGVQSMRWYNLELTGRECHTGTTPMDRRQDALLGAAKMIVETNRIVTSGALAERGARGTIAVLNSKPQSINTIAGKVQMNLDIRAPLDEDVAEIERLCQESFAKISNESGLGLRFENIWTSPAVHFNPVMIQCVRESCHRQSCTIELVSGAGHDSVYTSRRVPTAMIFVRCRDGVSHHPSEYSRPEDCISGVEVLLGAYLRYDEYIQRLHSQKAAY